MSAVELSPTLVSRLGALESLVLDPAVTEVLVAGPNSVWLTKSGHTEKLSLRIDEGAVRSLASRLVRMLAWKDSRATRTGLLSPELSVSIVGTPRGERCPVIRFARRTLPKRTLNELAMGGVVDRDAELRLLQACRSRRSIVIAGHPGSGRTEMLAALARVWKQERRVAVLDVQDGLLSAADVGHVTLTPSVGTEGAAMVGADVIVADEPSSCLWAQLFEFGRPFLATLEAADAKVALDRMVALCLSEQPEVSQVAGMALVESSVGLVVEMERANGRTLVRSISEPQRTSGQLSVRPLARPVPDGSTPVIRKEASELRSVAAIQKDPTPNFVVDGFGFETSDISEIRAESLMSASFIGRLPDPVLEAPPKPANETTGEIAPPEEAKAIRRSASERLPTLIGRADSGEIKTNAGMMPPLIDQTLGSMPPSMGEDETVPPDEQTMHAEAGEMTLDAEEADAKGQFNEQTPYSPFSDQKKNNSLTDEEIEGMLSDLEDVVHFGDEGLEDGGAKAKRRTRNKAR
jgi:pilus assembly protein CpaF